MFYYRINTKFVCLSSLISSVFEHNHENHGFDPETGTYNWYQSHGARFSKSNRLLSHMCSRFVIFVLFVQDVKMVKIKKNSDLDPNIQICAETSVGFYVFHLSTQVIIIKNYLQSVFINHQIYTVSCVLDVLGAFMFRKMKNVSKGHLTTLKGQAVPRRVICFAFQLCFSVSKGHPKRIRRVRSSYFERSNKISKGHFFFFRKIRQMYSKDHLAPQQLRQIPFPNNFERSTLNKAQIKVKAYKQDFGPNVENRPKT
ncbi:hypothetical protein HanIR_Chr02g0057211 [Helianthus annuus]|nr:hypothetical protein HanIR_Chr02g0057211 [Helianthus annuus]